MCIRCLIYFCNKYLKWILDQAMASLIFVHLNKQWMSFKTMSSWHLYLCPLQNNSFSKETAEVFLSAVQLTLSVFTFEIGRLVNCQANTGICNVSWLVGMCTKIVVVPLNLLSLPRNGRREGAEKRGRGPVGAVFGWHCWNVNSGIICGWEYS